MVLNDRYSQHARRALSRARLLAQDYQHGAVDTDHLLVGILRERGSLGAQVLLGLEVDSFRAEMEVRLLHGRGTNTALDLTEALHQVLSLSAEESRWFGHHYIGTEHLLLALARSREGGAPALMRVLLITPDQIRRRVRRLLQDGMTELSLEAAKRTARLSELSRRVLNAAEQLAAQQDNQLTGLDHLLLVLAGEKRSPVSRILRDSGLDRETLQAQLGHFSAEEPLNPQDLLEDVIDHAVDRADQLGTHYTGTDHILLALAENPYGARLLQQAGVNREQLITAIYRDLRLPQ